MTPEQAREAILAAVRALARGAVAGYGTIAARAGLPGRARLVARVLSQLPENSGVPWHRVLRADGRIAFPVGSACFQRQRVLLEAEGCRVAAGGRVEAAVAIRDRDDLDAALWG